jgi:hypothetical protein
MITFVFTPPFMTEHYLDGPDVKKHLDRLARIKLIHFGDADSFTSVMMPRPANEPLITILPRLRTPDESRRTKTISRG